MILTLSEDVQQQLTSGETGVIFDPIICSNIAPEDESAQEQPTQMELDEEFLARITTAQQMFGAPPNLVFLLRNNLLSRHQAEQLLLQLQERYSRKQSKSVPQLDQPEGEGTISSPIDLTAAPSSPPQEIIDLTGSPPPAATLASSTAIALQNEPPSNIRNNVTESVSNKSPLKPHLCHLE